MTDAGWKSNRAREHDTIDESRRRLVLLSNITCDEPSESFDAQSNCAMRKVKLMFSFLF